MKGGDISGSSAPRLLVVYEGLVGRLPDKRAEATLDRALKRKKWREALDCYETDASAAARLYDVHWRFSYAVDIITYHPEEFAVELRSRLDAERVPYGWCEATTPDEIARRCGWDMGIAGVFDADSRRVRMYGKKGGLMTDPRVQGFVNG